MRRRVGIKADGNVVHGWSSNVHVKISTVQESGHQYVHKLFEMRVLGHTWQTTLAVDRSFAGKIGLNMEQCL